MRTEWLSESTRVASKDSLRELLNGGKVLFHKKVGPHEVLAFKCEGSGAGAIDLPNGTSNPGTHGYFIFEDDAVAWAKRRLEGKR